VSAPPVWLRRAADRQAPAWATGDDRVRLLFPSGEGEAVGGPPDAGVSFDDVAAAAAAGEGAVADKRAPRAAPDASRPPAPPAASAPLSTAAAVQVEKAAKVHKAEADKSAQEAFSKLDRAIESIEQARTTLNSQATGEIVDLALIVAREILGHEPAWSGDRVIEAVREALLPFGGASSVVVRVSPADSDALASAQLRRSDGSLVDVVVDERLNSRDVIVETDIGRVDATATARLQQMERRLRATLGGRSS
jgi:hypothetical protein